MFIINASKPLRTETKAQRRRNSSAQPLHSSHLFTLLYCLNSQTIVTELSLKNRRHVKIHITNMLYHLLLYHDTR